MIEIVCTSVFDNKKVIESVFNYLHSKNSNIVLLNGEMGSGKTTLTYDIAETLNSKNPVSSPTFVIQKIYNLNTNILEFNKIYHIDLYRLVNVSDIESLNLFEDLKDKKNLFIIEWPDKIKGTLKNYVNVDIEVVEPEVRVFRIT